MGWWNKLVRDKKEKERLPDEGTDAARIKAKSKTPGQQSEGFQKMRSFQDIRENKLIVEAEKKDKGEYDEEGKMMKDQLDIVMDAADEIYDMVDDDDNLPEWCQNKITKAADYIDSVRDYLMSQNEDEDDDDDDEEDDDDDMKESVNEAIKMADVEKAMRKALKDKGNYKNGKVNWNFIDADVTMDLKPSKADQSAYNKMFDQVADKLTKSMKLKEDKQLDELSPSTLNNYGQKAAMARRAAIATQRTKRKAGDNAAADAAKKTADKRDKGLAQATARSQAQAGRTTGMPGSPAAKAAKKMPGSYYKKEEVEIDEAAPKMKGDWLKKEREKNRQHDAAMGRTATGRKKPVRQPTSTQRSLASLRKEEAKPDAAEVLRRRQQMKNISTSDKDKLSKVRQMLDKEKKK
jgi:hypothetical protein